MTKAFTTFIQKLRLNYDKRNVELSLTNGAAGLSLSLRYTNEYRGIGANLTPKQARALAAELIARADEIEGA